MSHTKNIRISIDRGGTFTDVHASVPGRDDIILKLLSVDPANYNDAPTEGIRRVLEVATGQKFPRGQPLEFGHIERLRMGTTVATNALLERKGAKSALLITKGFKDLLEIGNQSRPKIFDLSAAKPEVLFQRVVEIDERILPCPHEVEAERFPERPLVQGVTGENFRVLKTIDVGKVRKDLETLWQQGFRSIAVALLHSYAYPNHEEAVGDLALSMGFSVALSSKLQPMIKVVPRGMSATADAYLTPIIKDYVNSITSNFKDDVEDQESGCRFEFMQSDGGLVNFRNFSGLKAILSGPAGGVVGFSATSWDADERVPIIGFDMGGTSTDVSRFDGVYEHVFDAKISGVQIQSPQLDINTVAAGGGSVLTWRNGLFLVGPESASAHPGPACYRKGGPLTITDANLFIGRLLPEYFPKIFGPNEDQPLDREITARKFQELTNTINAEQKEQGRPLFTAEEVALGFLKVADESMARPIRNLTEARGFETAHHHLACFGGAGGQHACSVAAALGISRVIIHRYSSILSAYGLALAKVVKESQEPVSRQYSTSEAELLVKLDKLIVNSTQELVGEGFEKKNIQHEKYLNMRYEGSDTTLMILEPTTGDFATEFKERHRREFGFTSERPILVDDVRVRSTASSEEHTEKSPLKQLQAANLKDITTPPQEIVGVYFGGRYSDTPVYLLKSIDRYSKVYGPAIIIDETQTIVVSPNAVAHVLDTCVVIDLKERSAANSNISSSNASAHSSSSDLSPNTTSSDLSTVPTIDPIRLSIFGHRFMSIAEQMGRTLQKTAVSTNIKERLDFSCALFSPDGGLVANAPHVPVHLGSMQFAVRYQHDKWLGKLRDGDVLIANHPVCGGTHLPDITIITPVFDRPGGSTIVFYVASRGHHADIGGILPGSMPPKSTELWQEGATFQGEKVVENGIFQEALVTDLLFHKPSQFEGCSGSRNLSDNIADIKAQIAANARGILLIQKLISEYSLDCVQTYMFAIQKAAETAVRNLLKGFNLKYQGRPLEAEDHMDDGSVIRLKISINPTDGSAVFDFGQTSPEVYGNTNAPVAISHSAIIYCLRSLIASDIPLNQGCLAPIDIKIPPGCLLSPSPPAAVVGGNVVTSQRVTDVVLKAFHASAASQGCTNNITFGRSASIVDGKPVTGFGYYETLGGGGGAGPTWHGSHGIHVHMSNTRITDPEILEKRYPCLLRQFNLRSESGGKGKFVGGNGVVRELEFLTPMQVSILSERRVYQPYGMEGGEPGEAGVNTWITQDESTGKERLINLTGKNTVRMKQHDRLLVLTPGGGGWGIKDNR